MKKMFISLFAVCLAASVAAQTDSRIAFDSPRGSSNGTYEVYTIAPDGTNLTRITNNAAQDGGTAWAPDGSMLAYCSDRDGVSDLYLANADGSNARRITYGMQVTGAGSFSPDGTRIAFSAGVEDTNELYTIRADGTNLIRLTNDAANDQMPIFSPDGTKIVFSSTRDYDGGAYDTDVFVMNADGSNVVRLTHSPGRAFATGWSPDSKRIAYHEGMPGTFEVWTMNADGSNKTQLTFAPNDDGDPTFSPDGSHIAFISSREHAWTYDVWVMNADGSNPHAIFGDGTQHYSPRWSPSMTPHVSVDIKPGSTLNPINCTQGSTLIPVAVLGSATFDAATIDAASVHFGPGGATEVHGRAHLEDVNGDGRIDAVFHFRFGDTGLTCSDTSATLRGQAGGQSFAGSDTLRMVP